MTDIPTGTDEVLASVEDGVGHLVLNRPKAINALSTSMMSAVDRALDRFEQDPDVRVIVLSGTGDRGLCAGGDLRMMWESIRDGDDRAVEFFRTEYRLDSRIAHLVTPFLALMDGIVMGGGLGLSGHATFRVVTERSSVGMPEVTIGFVPDVGGLHLYARAPGGIGGYAALTGLGLGAGDCLDAGLADHVVPSERLPELVSALRTTDPAAAVGSVAGPAPEPALKRHRWWIDPCFAPDTVAEVLAALDATDDPTARETAALVRTKSPSALAVTLAALRRAATLPGLDAVLEQDFQVSCASLRVPDMFEGIRAQLIDKDRTPRWSPDTVTGVPADYATSFFGDQGHGTLGLLG